MQIECVRNEGRHIAHTHTHFKPPVWNKGFSFRLKLSKYFGGRRIRPCVLRTTLCSPSHFPVLVLIQHHRHYHFNRLWFGWLRFSSTLFLRACIRVYDANVQHFNNSSLFRNRYSFDTFSLSLTHNRTEFKLVFRKRYIAVSVSSTRPTNQRVD